ncbi:MAG TPA: hypothetical protein VFZ66_23010 [Herpetosiphonaceae bacterium]
MAEDRVTISIAASLNRRIGRVADRLRERELLFGGDPAPRRTQLIIALLEAGLQEAQQLRQQGQIPPAVRRRYPEPGTTVAVPRALQQRLQIECHARTNELPPAERQTVVVRHLVDTILTAAVERYEAALAE